MSQEKIYNLCDVAGRLEPFAWLRNQSFRARHATVKNPSSQAVPSKDGKPTYYTQPPNVKHGLERLNLPFVAIRSKPSVFFSETFWKEWQTRCPDTASQQDLAYGHLLPLEKSSTCWELIQAGLSEIA